MKIAWEIWRLAMALCLGFLIGGVIASTRCHAQHPAPPVVTSVNLGRDMTPTTVQVVPPVQPMVVPAIEEEYGKYGFNLCDMECTFYPISDSPGVSNFGVKLYRKSRLTCLDKRRVVVTAESGASLCILFPDPVPPVVKVKLLAPKPLAAPKPVPVKLSPPPYDGKR